MYAKISAHPAFTDSSVILTELLHSSLFVLISDENIHIFYIKQLSKYYFLDLPFQIHTNSQTTCKHTTSKGGILYSAEIHAHGEEA